MFKPHYKQNNQYEITTGKNEKIKAYGVNEAQAKLAVYSNKPGIVIAKVVRIS